MCLSHPAPPPFPVRPTQQTHQVYASLEPAAYFLKLADKGAGLSDVWAAMQKLQAAIATLNWYYAVNGVSILLLIAR